MAEDDLFPGFDRRLVQTSSGRIHVRTGGKGPPLLLLHGYPQNHVMWHRVAPALAKHFSLVVADLPGYGESEIPQTDADHTPYTKRAMANAMVGLMEQLGHRKFRLAGHDRGGRVAYRMAFDHPDRLERVAVLDILPTYEYWANLNRVSALRIYHWTFLAQPHPIPERLICSAPKEYFSPAFKSGFDPRAVRSYLEPFEDPERVKAACEDYRAGAYQDFEHDKADLEAGRKISVPLHVIWGSKGIASAAAASPIENWRRWATTVSGEAVEAGHFMCEENPGATETALLAFFGRGND
jgi:haloacetate dehalogenase